MKKFVLPAIAAAAFGIGGVAQADVIDNVGSAISRIFGVPYDPRPLPQAPVAVAPAVPVVNGIYTDAYGRRYHVDAAGRHIALDQYGTYRDAWGRTVYLGANSQPIYIEQDGRLIPYATGTYAARSSNDRDGDGVTNWYDRYPQDSRYR